MEQLCFCAAAPLVAPRSAFTPATTPCAPARRPVPRRPALRASVKEEESAPPASFTVDTEADEVSASTSASETPSSSSSSSSSPVSAKLPVVAVVGRPNVGKSTLVNRLSGTFRSGAIVEDVVGITRDRTYRATEWNGHSFAVVDTGGLVFDDQSMFLPEIREQALVAMREASVIILCVDGMAGLNPLDDELASFLRREVHGNRGRNSKLMDKNAKKGEDKKVIVVVNKCESTVHGPVQASDFWQLGLGEPFPVSAIHGSGTGDLMDMITDAIPYVEKEEADDVINVAIVGRPNVGKSSLLNSMLGTARAIVSDVPGTTRDSVDEVINISGQRYRLIDTAGIRRKTNVEFGTEFFMVNRAFRAIRRADVVLLLQDIGEASEQDRKIAERIRDEGKACIVLGNKWDLVDEKNNRSYNKYIDDLRNRSVAISWAPVELISVKSGQRLKNIIDLVNKAVEQHRRRISTATLNEVLREAVEWHRPPSTKQGKQGRLYYCTQVGIAPPTIAMFVNDPKLFHDNYRRYMEGQFRKSLGFAGSPLRILWRGKARPPSLS